MRTSFDSVLQRVLFIQSQEPRVVCPNEERVGGFTDGGKWLCQPRTVLTTALLHNNCMVYSFGSRMSFGFEEGVSAIAPNCETHIFDPTPSVRKAIASKVLPRNFHYHAMALTGPNKSLRIENELVSHEYQERRGGLRMCCVALQREKQKVELLGEKVPLLTD